MNSLCYLGLGSNQGDRAAHLLAAVRQLGEHGVAVEKVSDGYETEPIGEIVDQPDFLNAVAVVCTDLAPLELLDLCKAIEAEHGRMFAAPRHGPRPVDIDVLLVGDEVMSDPRLTLPHPQIGSRRFVLEPLLELDPGLRLPDGSAAADLLKALGDAQRVDRLGPLEGLSTDQG